MWFWGPLTVTAHPCQHTPVSFQTGCFSAGLSNVLIPSSAKNKQWKSQREADIDFFLDWKYKHCSSSHQMLVLWYPWNCIRDGFKALPLLSNSDNPIKLKVFGLQNKNSITRAKRKFLDVVRMNLRLLLQKEGSSSEAAPGLSSESVHLQCVHLNPCSACLKWALQVVSSSRLCLHSQRWSLSRSWKLKWLFGDTSVTS